jgi:transcriptional regulator with XRE-family HTH domain
MRSPFFVEFGARVRAARRHARLTQAELGNRLGLDRSTIAGIESGRQGVQLDDLVDLAHALGCPPGDLLPDKNLDMPSDGASASSILRRVSDDKAGAAFVLRVRGKARGDGRTDG